MYEDGESPGDHQRRAARLADLLYEDGPACGIHLLRDGCEVVEEQGTVDTKVRATAVVTDRDGHGPSEDNESDADHLPRRFELVRSEDVSGTSGTGVVAVGVAYPDGAVHMQWRNAENGDLGTASNGVAFKPAPDGVEATEEIHGHGGRTEIRWVD